MYPKFALIFLSSLLLGGCTLLSLSSKDENAATDIINSSPSPSLEAIISPSPDPELNQILPTNEGSDIDSIETDLNNTSILKEDFTDLN